jgi:twinfilin-like protein
LEPSDATLRPLTPVSYPIETQYTFQQALNRLDAVLNPNRALYLILRRDDLLVAITYVPYLASAESKKSLLEHRNELVKSLGQEKFAAAIICKEVGEITDARSWDERDGQGQSWKSAHSKGVQSCENYEVDDAENEVKDFGYKKNNCRLCDRRMKNKINDDALEALGKLDKDGACVQLVSRPIEPYTTR